MLVAGYRPQTALVVLMVGLAKACESLSDVFYGLLQQRERMDRIAKSMLIKGPASFAAFTAALWLTGSVMIATACLAATWALVFAAYDIGSGRAVLRVVTRGGSSPVEAGPRPEGLGPRFEWPMLGRLCWIWLGSGLQADAGLSLCLYGRPRGSTLRLGVQSDNVNP